MGDPLLRHWPLYRLRLRTPRLELRLPDAEQLATLADLAAEGVHDPAIMPFSSPWTDNPPAERAQSVVQHHWRSQGSWSPDDWSLELAVFEDGQAVGLQGVGATSFPTVREVGTGSWLGLRYHGHGIGTHMRAAVLHLAFAGLDAVAANTGAMEDNLASQRVSAKLGYADNGVAGHRVRDSAKLEYRYRMTRERWEANRNIAVTVEGLDECREMFGLEVDQSDGAAER